MTHIKDNIMKTQLIVYHYILQVGWSHTIVEFDSYWDDLSAAYLKHCIEEALVPYKITNYSRSIL